MQVKSFYRLPYGQWVDNVQLLKKCIILRCFSPGLLFFLPSLPSIRFLPFYRSQDRYVFCMNGVYLDKRPAAYAFDHISCYV